MTLLRLGHRRERDKRVTTHVFLLARAFLVTHGYYTGEKDPQLEETIQQVVASWGGKFTIRHVASYRKIINSFEGITVHLTMYGEPHYQAIPRINKDLSTTKPNSLLVIVGSSKVPADVYKLVDYNVAVSHQPHSEISALAIFLHELLGNNPLYHTYSNAKIKLSGGEKGWGKKQISRNMN